MEKTEQKLITEERRQKTAAYIRELRIAGRVLKEAKPEETPQEFEERAHQLDAWANLWEARHNGTTSALVHMATGLGKTSVAVFDIMKFQAERKEQKKRPPRVLFVCHQDNILKQAKDRFLEFIPEATTNYFKTKRPNLPEADITFATFQSLRNELDRFPPDYFDYIIYDEAHHTKAETFSDVVEHFKPEFQLALTATPERTDKEDIREHFGEPVYSKSLAEAMAEGLVAEPDYHIKFDDAVTKAMQEGFRAETLKDLRALSDVKPRNETIAKNVLDERERIGLEDAKTIVFCNSVAHANQIAKLLGGEAYHSKVPKKKRGGVLERFRSGELQIITTRDMFNEGVDIPDARLIVFLRSTQSKTVFEQQLGRGLRKHKGKTVVSVLDFVANVERLAMIDELKKEKEEHYRELSEEAREGISGGEGGFQDTTSHGTFEFDQLAVNILERFYEITKSKDRSHLDLLTNEAVITLAQRYSPNKPLTDSDIDQLSKEGGFPGTYSITKRFGPIAEFQKACGFEVKIRKYFSQLSNEELAQLARELSPNKPLTGREMNKLSKKGNFMSPSTIKKRFGSMRKFQEACGFKPN